MLLLPFDGQRVFDYTREEHDEGSGLTRAGLIDQVDCAMPDMARLMGLQEQGWAYIKP